MLKNIILWKYERASWQWDLLCFLIILFIFLTPKDWFEKREATQKPRVAVKVQDFSPDKIKINKLSGIPKLNENTSGEKQFLFDIR
jgi:hypothetical protein